MCCQATESLPLLISTVRVSVMPPQSSLNVELENPMEEKSEGFIQILYKNVQFATKKLALFISKYNRSKLEV